MITRKEDALREEFRKLLRDLALKQDLLKDVTERDNIYRRLEDIYVPLENEKVFRHYYSDIFSELILIHQDPSKGDIEIIGQNLSIVKKYYDSDKGKKNVSDCVNKLYDHVSLEIARITYSDAGDREVSQEGAIANIEAKINEVMSKIKEATNSQDILKKDIEEQKKDMGRQQREYIAILGIFASIVLSFTTGIAFSTSVLENIHAVSIYRTIIIVLIIGLVLINIMYGLFYYINKLVIQTTKKTIMPLLITNGIFIVMIVSTIICWSVGMVEKRNDRIEMKTFVGEQEETLELDDSIDNDETEKINGEK